MSQISSFRKNTSFQQSKLLSSTSICSSSNNKKLCLKYKLKFDKDLQKEKSVIKKLRSLGLVYANYITFGVDRQ